MKNVSGCNNCVQVSLVAFGAVGSVARASSVALFSEVEVVAAVGAGAVDAAAAPFPTTKASKLATASTDKLDPFIAFVPSGFDWLESAELVFDDAGGSGRKLAALLATECLWAASIPEVVLAARACVKVRTFVVFAPAIGWEAEVREILDAAEPAEPKEAPRPRCAIT